MRIDARLSLSMTLALALGGCGATEVRVAPAVAEPSQPVSLDGHAYRGRTAHSGLMPQEDAVTFNAGLFDAESFRGLGFQPCRYNARAQGDHVMFHCEAESDGQGTMVWEGRVDGTSIRASATWSKFGQREIIYTFEGGEQPAAPSLPGATSPPPG